MNKNLTVQEALAELLAEKKNLLNDSNALMIALRERVAKRTCGTCALHAISILP